MGAGDKKNMYGMEVRCEHDARVVMAAIQIGESGTHDARTVDVCKHSPNSPEACKAPRANDGTNASSKVKTYAAQQLQVLNTLDRP